MVSRVNILCLIAFAPSAVFSQNSNAPITFEVASVKPSGPSSIRGSDGGPGSSDPERYIFNRASLQDLIAVAYDVKYFQISSPIPLDRDSFDLAARVPPGASQQQFRLMMQRPRRGTVPP